MARPRFEHPVRMAKTHRWNLYTRVSAPDGRRTPPPGRHPSMNTSPQPRRSGPAALGSPRPLPTTIWLPDDPHDPADAPTPEGVLPRWAVKRIRTAFPHRPDQDPTPLVRILLRDTEPGMDARTPCTTTGMAGRPLILLAELHPDTLPTPTDDLTTTHDEMPAAMENGWAGFFHRAHHLLTDDGLLLLATRQRRDTGRLSDPLGSLIACARTAGFRYLQHIVIVHGHPVGNRIAPAPPDGAPPGLIHSDLLVLSPLASA
jgi:hypothetical protein